MVSAPNVSTKIWWRNAARPMEQMMAKAQSASCPSMSGETGRRAEDCPLPKIGVGSVEPGLSED